MKIEWKKSHRYSITSSCSAEIYTEQDYEMGSNASPPYTHYTLYIVRNNRNLLVVSFSKLKDAKEYIENNYEAIAEAIERCDKADINAKNKLESLIDMNKIWY